MIFGKKKNAAEERVALVTGANRGIGLEICRQLTRKGLRVVLTARDAKKGKAACARLGKEGIEVFFQRLDVTEAESVRRAAESVEKEFGRLDILVNNAGINVHRGANALNLPVEVLRETMEANAYGPLLLCQTFLPLLKKSPAGRVVNVSSGQGCMNTMGSGQPAYRISKAALNAVTRILADELRGTGILVNSVHPGWVRTDMGGRHASKSVEEGADTPVWLALLPEGGPTSGHFRDRKPAAW
ncbi:MAG: SDR family oxidoreductase [bacterium]